jgi:hypothetical protein
MIYCDRLGFVNLDWLRLCRIDPPPHPSRQGKGLVARNATLRFGFVSQNPNSQNLTGRSIETNSTKNHPTPSSSKVYEIHRALLFRFKKII